MELDFFSVLNLFVCRSEETVEVGAPLYEIDTDAEATVTNTATSKDSPKSEAPPAEEKVAAAAAAAPPKAPAATTPQHRTPSIHFLGKEGWAARLRGVPAVADLPPIHPMYGRPAFTEEEMEALMLGGAEQAPKLVTPSSGAIFA